MNAITKQKTKGKTMHKLTLLLILGILVGCGGNSENSADNSINKPSAPNEKPKSKASDVPIPYFSESGHQIRVVKQFEFNFSDDRFRGLTFHYGTRLQANEHLGDGRGCVILQPLATTDMGPILVQNLANITPIGREALGTEVPDDFMFYGVKFDFTVVGSGILYCFRHESLGPVTLEDFRDHFASYLEFL